MSDTPRPHQEERRQLDPTMQRVVEALEAAVGQLTETVRILHSAVFGRWDDQANRTVPGLHERILEVEVKVDSITKAGRKYMYYIVGPALVVLVAGAIGIPTDKLWVLLFDFIRHFGGTS